MQNYSIQLTYSKLNECQVIHHCAILRLAAKTQSLCTFTLAPTNEKKKRQKIIIFYYSRIQRNK